MRMIRLGVGGVWVSDMFGTGGLEMGTQGVLRVCLGLVKGGFWAVGLLVGLGLGWFRDWFRVVLVLASGWQRVAKG